MPIPFKNTGAPGLAMIPSNGSHSMYSSHSYNQPTMPPMYQDPNLPNKYMFQNHPAKLNMSAMDARDFNPMPKESMANLTDQFNHSMNIGHNFGPGLTMGMHNSQNVNKSMTLNPPGFNPHPSMKDRYWI